MQTTLTGVTLGVLSTMLSASTGKGGEKPSEEPVVPINPTAITGLHPHTALKMEGAADQLDQLPENMVLRWVGRGSVTWKVNVPEPGDYEVALCYAANKLAEGAQFEIISTDSKITGKIHKTEGIYKDRPISQRKPIDRPYLQTYERVPLKGVLHLSAGTSKITIHVTEPKSGDVMDLRSMELTPVAAKESIAAEKERAKKSRVSTDWFVEAGYGVMFHWTDASQPRRGPKKPYAEAVRYFDVEAFADMVQETGAGYVLFTLNHAHPHCPAPITFWGKIHPGWTTQRDLVGEIAHALDKRGIKLMLYLAAHLIGKPDDMSEPAFLRRMINVRFPEGGFAEDRHVKILTEIGRRYGKKLAGYWFDGWDLIPEQHPSVSFERLFKATKVGNPARIISYNFWICPDETPWQEYWAGEIDGPLKPVLERYIEYAAGEGLQLHTLIMLEDTWVHETPNTEMEQPTFSEEELISFVKSYMAKRGVVTINLCIYQDGTIGKKSLKVMQALRGAVRK